MYSVLYAAFHFRFSHCAHAVLFTYCITFVSLIIVLYMCTVWGQMTYSGSGHIGAGHRTEANEQAHNRLATGCEPGLPRSVCRLRILIKTRTERAAFPRNGG